MVYYREKEKGIENEKEIGCFNTVCNASSTFIRGRTGGITGRPVTALASKSDGEYLGKR